MSFTTLIESQRVHHWSPGEISVSLVAHTGLILLAIILAPQAGAKIREVTPEAIQFLRPAPEPPPPEPQVQPEPLPVRDAVVAPPVAKGFQVLVAPVNIPDKIPEVDLSRAITDEADFSGRGVAGGVANGVEGGVPIAKKEALQEQVYFATQVEKPVVPKEGSAAPIYPEMLRAAGIEGEVYAQFVVDTAGRVEKGSFVVIRSTHDGFSDAVRSAVANMRFYPAEVGSRKVRMLVQQPFVFKIQ
ncbi:MAG TPA: TonB family protein [Gemmatimonadaceae bacterium]|nr:TonB family protein [Gemmatimonadaceae bacterium]